MWRCDARVRTWWWWDIIKSGTIRHVGATPTLCLTHISLVLVVWNCGQYRNFYFYSTSPQVEFVCDCTMHVIKYLYIYPEAQWSWWVNLSFICLELLWSPAGVYVMEAREISSAAAAECFTLSLRDTGHCVGGAEAEGQCPQFWHWYKQWQNAS